MEHGESVLSDGTSGAGLERTAEQMPVFYNVHHQTCVRSDEIQTPSEDHSYCCVRKGRVFLKGCVTCVIGDSRVYAHRTPREPVQLGNLLLLCEGGL